MSWRGIGRGWGEVEGVGGAGEIPVVHVLECVPQLNAEVMSALISLAPLEGKRKVIKGRVYARVR